MMNPGLLVVRRKALVRPSKKESGSSVWMDMLGTIGRILINT